MFGQVWCLIVSILDLCPLSYFVGTCMHVFLSLSLVAMEYLLNHLAFCMLHVRVPESGERRFFLIIEVLKNKSASC